LPRARRGFRGALLCLLFLAFFAARPLLQSHALNAQLLEAAGKGDAAAVTALLDKGADIEADNGRGATPLYVAAEQGQLEVVKVLLARGANAHVKDLEWGRTPLRHASLPDSRPTGKTARAEIIKLLLEKGAGAEGDALVDLIQNGHPDAARKIIAGGSVDPSYLNVALAAAKREKHPELVELLTKAGAKEPGPLDSPRSPERLKLITGVYRNGSGEQLILGSGLQGNSLLISRPGQDSIALLPLDFRTFRSFDMKIVMNVKAGALPPSELTLKQGSRSEVFTRIGDAPAPARTAAAATPKATAARAPRPSPAGLPGARAGNWPSFRGVGASGIAQDAHPPTTWNVPNGVNVRWKTSIPGLGHSSPVIWGDKIFVTTAIPAKEDAVMFRHGASAGSNVDAINRSTRDEVPYAWRVYALDRRTGKILWERVAHEGMPHSQRHVSQSQANSTPAVDGAHLVVWFGSEGLYCYDLNGKLLWKVDLGPLKSGYVVDPSYEWNTASSPVIYNNLVILQVDLVKGSFIAAFDIRTGKKIWQTDRDDDPSWATPLVYEGPTRTEIVTLAPRFARGYDPTTGKELWRLGKHSIYASPTPIAGHDLFYVTSGSGNSVQPIYAIRGGAAGNITLKDDEDANEFVVWSKIRGGAYIPTPILYENLLYVCAEGGILSAYNVDTGERVYQQRLARGSYSASPVAADGKLYFANEDGDVTVVKTGETFEKLAENPTGELLMATPAISQDMIIFRTGRSVVAVGESASRSGQPPGVGAIP
jgi:outer membrane protein assembly factor BamB